MATMMPEGHLLWLRLLVGLERPRPLTLRLYSNVVSSPDDADLEDFQEVALGAAGYAPHEVAPRAWTYADGRMELHYEFVFEGRSGLTIGGWMLTFGDETLLLAQPLDRPGHVRWGVAIDTYISLGPAAAEEDRYER